MSKSRPILRYWNCRARAQPLRDLLVDRDIDFVDERREYAKDPAVAWHDTPAWKRMKADPAVSGPFGTLPVLEWEVELIAEEVVIGTFLTKRLGLDRGRRRR